MTVPNGGTVVCTITNDDDQGSLQIVKKVVNDNGGSATAASFGLNTTAGALVFGGGVEAPANTFTYTSGALTVNAGSYTLRENDIAGYTEGTWSCTGATPSNTSISAGAVTVPNGGTVVCTITNNDIPATLTVNKVCDPTSDTGKFNLLIDGVGTTDSSCGGSTGAVFVNAGLHTVSETAGTETNLSNYVSTISGNCNSAGSITAVLGVNYTCTITNTKKGMATVVKTVHDSGSNTDNLPSGSQSFTFQLRQGASAIATGTILESGTANAANGGTINFSTKLIPGQTYQLCETVMPGWMTTLGPPFYTVFNPSGDNSTVCTDFTVAAGETKEFDINNIPPPGGLTRTIGFWKNWSSCTGGGQAPKLDQTLALAEPGGVLIGDLTLHGNTSTPNVSPDCLKAVRILNKSTIDLGKKKASDPAFNLAAQLLAAKLNVQAGAGVCPAAVTAINAAQSLLDLINFNGIAHATMTSAQVTQANSLAGTLDQYNNDNTLLCSGP